MYIGLMPALYGLSFLFLQRKEEEKRERKWREWWGILRYKWDIIGIYFYFIFQMEFC